MKKLTKKDLIQIIKEEWNKKVNSLTEEKGLTSDLKINGSEIDPLKNAEGLKVWYSPPNAGKNFKGQLYTLLWIDERQNAAALKNSTSGDEIIIPLDELEKNYGFKKTDK